MSLEFYKLLHLVGIFLILLALGGVSLHMLNGGTRSFPNRRWIAMAHGFGLLITLIAGFGMLARLQLMASFPGWAIGKLMIWLILGLIPLFFYRQPKIAKALWFLVLILASTSAWLALFKPF